MVKNPPVMQETRAQSVGQEDPLEKGMTTHSSILAWRIPWMRACQAIVHGFAESDMTQATEHAHMQCFQRDIDSITE